MLPLLIIHQHFNYTSVHQQFICVIDLLSALTKWTIQRDTGVSAVQASGFLKKYYFFLTVFVFRGLNKLFLVFLQTSFDIDLLNKTTRHKVVEKRVKKKAIFCIFCLCVQSHLSQFL